MLLQDIAWYKSVENYHTKQQDYKGMSKLSWTSKRCVHPKQLSTKWVTDIFQGGLACRLSKWDTEKANRLFIHVLIWWLFWSLLSHFHFKCQRTSFRLCQRRSVTWRDGTESAALAERDGFFFFFPKDASLALALAAHFLVFPHEYGSYCEKKRVKDSVSLIPSPALDHFKRIKINK